MGKENVISLCPNRCDAFVSKEMENEKSLQRISELMSMLERFVEATGTVEICAG